MVLLKTSQRFEELKNVVVSRLGVATEFARDNPVLTGGALGTVGLLSAVQIARVAKRRKKKAPTRKVRRVKRKVKGHKRKKRAVVRGRGLGKREIHHGHKGSKLVSFRTKGGKMVKFKVKGTQKTHLGKRRIKRRRKT